MKNNGIKTSGKKIVLYLFVSDSYATTSPPRTKEKNVLIILF
jgi:hypothetical protein